MGIFLRYLSAPTPQKGPDAAAQRGGYGAPPPLGVGRGAPISVQHLAHPDDEPL